jgi:hypothetical protein
MFDIICCNQMTIEEVISHLSDYLEWLNSEAARYNKQREHYDVLVDEARQSAGRMSMLVDCADGILVRGDSNERRKFIAQYKLLVGLDEKMSKNSK